MYMTFWKRQKMQEQTADHCLPGVRGWEKFESRGCMGEFFGVLELFYILVLVVVMKIRACAKSQNCTSERILLYANLKLLKIKASFEVSEVAEMEKV